MLGLPRGECHILGDLWRPALHLTQRAKQSGKQANQVAYLIDQAGKGIRLFSISSG